jgi:hypothetical protein
MDAMASMSALFKLLEHLPRQAVYHHPILQVLTSCIRRPDRGVARSWFSMSKSSEFLNARYSEKGCYEFFARLQTPR